MYGVVGTFAKSSADVSHFTYVVPSINPASRGVGNCALFHCSKANGPDHTQAPSKYETAYMVGDQEYLTKSVATGFGMGEPSPTHSLLEARYVTAKLEYS